MTRLCLALALLLAISRPAQACTLAPRPEAGPPPAAWWGMTLAQQARWATDVLVVRAEVTPLAKTLWPPLPPSYFGPEDADWALPRPVGYDFIVVRRIKGTAAARFPVTIPRWAYNGRTDVWLSAWSERWFGSDEPFYRLQMGNDDRMPIPRFGLAVHPGNCSTQISFQPGRLYLVTRGSDGEIGIAEPLAENDTLPDFMAAAIARRPGR